MEKRRLRKVRNFVEENKKLLLTIGGILGTGVLTIVSHIVREQKDPEPYTARWLEGLSDDELREEHEKARLSLREARDDWDLACEMDSLRRRIAAEIQNRKGDGMDNYVSPSRREHGNNL